MLEVQLHSVKQNEKHVAVETKVWKCKEVKWRGRGRVYTVNPHIANIIHKRISGIFVYLKTLMLYPSQPSMLP